MLKTESNKYLIMIIKMCLQWTRHFLWKKSSLKLLFQCFKTRSLIYLDQLFKVAISCYFFYSFSFDKCSNSDFKAWAETKERKGDHLIRCNRFVIIPYIEYIGASMYYTYVLLYKIPPKQKVSNWSKNKSQFYVLHV